MGVIICFNSQSPIKGTAIAGYFMPVLTVLNKGVMRISFKHLLFIDFTIITPSINTDIKTEINLCEKLAILQTLLVRILQ